MRAVMVTEHGATPIAAEVPKPQPRPGQILTRLCAAGLNPMDRRLASVGWRPAPATFPMVLGADGAGCRQERVTRFALGDEVFFHGRPLSAADRRRFR
jgi:NADPH:quinone reductase-like Zn-dependent oxidoreductase